MDADKIVWEHLLEMVERLTKITYLFIVVTQYKQSLLKVENVHNFSYCMVCVVRLDI